MAAVVSTIFFDLGETLVTKPNKWLPNAQSLLSALKQKGFRLGILSNTGDLKDRQSILALLPKNFPIDIFEPSLVLFSSEVHVEKPAKRIFQLAVQHAKVPARECLYCSESIVETLMAQHAGMLSIRVQTLPNSDLANIAEVMATLQSLITQE